MVKVSTAEQAQRTWAKTPDRMLVFAPNTCPHPQQPEHAGRWLLADQWAVLAIGFSADDMAEARADIKRRM